MMKMGCRPNIAKRALQQSGGSVTQALHAIRQDIANDIANNPYANITEKWSPKIVVRIRSWLPNIKEPNKPDYYTGYVASVTYTDIIDNSLHCWQITVRYSTVKALHDHVMKYVQDTKIIAPFPKSSLLEGLRGISDEERNNRMIMMDRWLQEVLMNSIILTTKQIADYLSSFIELESHS